MFTGNNFLFRYQNLNNGKFPSLNLTHKEVGGSFYTVREIVREIIQQNRVLRPGNSTSKALNLEYCPEELAGKSLSVDISDPLSISTINYAVDQGQGESLSPIEYRRTSTDIIEVDESVTVSQEYPESHPNDTFASQVPNGERCSEISNDAYLNGKLDGSSSNEPSLGTLSGVEDENLGVCAQTYSEVQVHSCSQISGKVEHLVPSFEAVSMTPPLFESLVIDDDNGNTSNFMTKEINSSVASSSPTLSDSLSEANVLLDPIPTSTCDGEDPSVSPGIESCNAGKYQKIMGVTTSLEVPKTSGFDEVEVASIAFEKDSLINKSEATETLSSIGLVEGSAASSSRQLSMEKDSILHKPETLEALSSAAVDEMSDVNLNQSVSQNLDSPSLGIRRPPVSFDPTETLSSIVSDEISDESVIGSASQNLDRQALGSRRPVVSLITYPGLYLLLCLRLL